jgi:predicted O-linked N-acetylglucosamine transferase (SPINDLY family)
MSAEPSEAPVSLDPQVDIYHRQAQQAQVENNYGLAISLYEQAIQHHPENRSSYWHLGLMLLFQAQEAEAQTTWLMAMVEGEPDQIVQWTAELLQVLETAAAQQTQLQNYGLAWSIRQHMREIAPESGDNLLHLLGLSAQQGTLNGDEIADLGIVPLLQTGPSPGMDASFLLQVLESTLAMPAHPIMMEFTLAILPHITDPVACDLVLIKSTLKLASEQKQPQLAASLLEHYVDLAANRVDILPHLAALYQQAGDYERSITVARELLELAPTLVGKIIANYLLLRSLMEAGGLWHEAETALAYHKVLFSQLFQEQPQDISPDNTLTLLNTGFFLPYFHDDLPTHRSLQNQLAQICQLNVRRFGGPEIAPFRQGIAARHAALASLAVPTTKRLKIGYLSHCLGRHSVGWLARWLLQHHDRDQFQLHGYFLKEFTNDGLHDWYLNQVDKVCRVGTDCEAGTLALAAQIYQDEIDILVDLDSITSHNTCDLLTLKPAPIQVTWLGWDASGLDTIDYFLADPYVLPDTAQAHYTEKIWRLPHTYVAVDGFEVGVPNVRRENLQIPSDAVIFLSAQAPYKRHPEAIRLQLQIIREVPNSYFLVKSPGNPASLQSFFVALAAEMGVNPDRLRFLPSVRAEEIHRANLSIADVVLDTFPYNGATTTLETLWMGVPLVTRVGQQFASRNSYTMLKNVGIEEGIAWTDAEYVEWGVRLGTDAMLRRQVANKLWRSRQTAPLWNAAAFTHEVEQAYQEMWRIYQQKSEP